MKYLRWALGALVGLYVLRNLYYFGLTVGSKTGAMALTGDNAAVKPFVDALAWWFIVLWAALIVAYTIAAFRFLRGGRATIPMLVAVVLDAGTLFVMRGMATYQQLIPTDVKQLDLIGVITMAVVLVLAWWTERGSAPATTATA
jgi:hypothetical protein